MAQFPNVQPDEIEHSGHTIALQYFGTVKNIALELAVVSVTPGIVDEVDQVLGLGSHEYEAKADAFARARRLIDCNRPAAP